MKKMNFKRSRMNEKIKKKYSMLFDHHIQCILQSGTLLDEDMDILLERYNVEIVQIDNQGLTFFKKLFGACSAAFTIIALQKKYSVFYAMLSASPLAYIGLQRVYDNLYLKKRMRNLEITLITVRDMAQLNRMILEHFHARRLTNSKTIIDPYTRGMRKLIDTISSEVPTLLYTFRKFIRQFGKEVRFLTDEYEHLEKLNLDTYYCVEVTNVNEGYLYLKQVSDAYLLMSSGCLTCLGLVLCPSVWTYHNVNFDEVINDVVPCLKQSVLFSYNAIKRKFDNVKYYHLIRNQPRKNVEKPILSASDKLKMSAYYTMSFTNDIIDNSKLIYNKIQEVDLQKLDEKEKLEESICELRRQVFEFHESLDLLHKLFQVKIKESQCKPLTSNLEIPEIISGAGDVTVVDASLNSVDPSQDEEYELTIGANVAGPSEDAVYSCSEEEHYKYASLLGQELKEKLKNNRRFMDARKKRGIIDEEAEKVAEVSEDDLLPLVHSVDSEKMAAERHSSSSIPPPPPPLPPIELNALGDNHGSLYTVTDFLDAIKVASKSRQNVEEVFGSSSDEEPGDN